MMSMIEKAQSSLKTKLLHFASVPRVEMCPVYIKHTDKEEEEGIKL